MPKSRIAREVDEILAKGNVRSVEDRHHARTQSSYKTGTIETRLPDAAAKDTKKATHVMKAFNAKVERLLDQAGAQLDYEMKGEPLDHRRFLLETKAGAAFVTPYGNWVAVRFNDPEAAVKLVGTLGLNTYSGKWNHHYFAWPINEATGDVARWLKKITV
jgi:hypothetical protein